MALAVGYHGSSKREAEEASEVEKEIVEEVVL
jgi:hypothetical protein